MNFKRFLMVSIVIWVVFDYYLTVCGGLKEFLNCFLRVCDGFRLFSNVFIECFDYSLLLARVLKEFLMVF